MKYWLDCEFNGGKGELISLALVDEGGREFYTVLPLPTFIQPWVAENVVPVLYSAANTPGIVAPMFARAALSGYLFTDRTAHIIADYPADIAYFCDFMLLDTQGKWIRTPKLTFEICPSLNYISAVPHNALADARGIKRAWDELEGGA